MSSPTHPPRPEILGAMGARYQEILTPEALGLLGALVDRFEPRRKALLGARLHAQARYDRGELPAFREDTAAIRASDWSVQPAPADLADRRVEITGPVDRKMIINALNSGANVFMADFEDSTSPTWANLVEGQIHLFDAVRRQIDFTHPETGKHYALADDPAVLMVRPRGLHLVERGLELDGPVSGALMDAALYVFHNARELVARGSGPYLYLPKLQSHEEAALWSDVLSFLEDALELSRGTIRVTVLIETLPAVFEMDEILWALRHHVTGLNCGRWDYIFSCIKTWQAHPDRVLPDRAAVGMTQPFLRAYTLLQVETCHRRGAHAMGGMAAQIPIKDDEEANTRALAKVRADKEREAADGHDGTWVAHPALVPLARAAFDAVLDGPNQLHVRPGVSPTPEELHAVPTGPRTEAGLRTNLRVGVQYLEAWLRGSGCVPIDHLMEDAATAEISRTQVWQWVRHGARLDDGRVVTAELVRATLDEELARLRQTVGDARFAAGRFDVAASLFDELCTASTLPEFLTLTAIDHLTN